MIQFYHDRRLDMLKLGCTLPHLANSFLHSSRSANFYPFPEGNEDLLEKNENTWQVDRQLFSRGKL